MEELIALVSHPSRYLGGEINSIKKDLTQVSLKVCLAFPDVYEVGMSHLGLQILYHILNARPDIAAERVYAPGLDMERVMGERGALLTSLESALPLNQFEVVGFSLQYELSYTNVLAMLELSGIPLYASQRKEESPLIIGGGPCAFNPEPLADFFDAFVIGEGEEVIIEICDCIINAKREKRNKQEVLTLLSQIEGVYVPSFFQIEYHPQGTVKKIVALHQGYERVKKRWVSNLDETLSLSCPMVPYKKIVHDRANLEIARGCTRGCRFCQAGILYRPVRERRVETIETMAHAALSSSGYEEVSLSSLSTGDYSQIEVLLRRLMGRYANQKIAVSFPSVRSETLTPELIGEIKKVRKTGFTIAPEAGTQRLRDVINKGFGEKEILDTIGNVFDAGWNAIKLYFMIGLPSEREEDLKAIVELSRKARSLARRGGKQRKINVSVSTFVPKSHTPFQWEPQIGLSTILAKQEFLKNEIRKLHLTFKWQDGYMSYLEGIFARGDRRLGSILVHAYEKGCRFDGWSEYLNDQWWNEALKTCETDFYTTRRREKDELFPWDHIDSGVDRNFLWSEYQKGLEARFTPDCRVQGCLNCGICGGREQSIRLSTKEEAMGSRKEFSSVPMVSYNQLPRKVDAVHRVRLKFSKLKKGRFLSHLELITLFSRAFRRAGIPLRFTEGFHPLPKIVFGPALPVGIESNEEYLDIEIIGTIDTYKLKQEINQQLPEWIKILETNEIPLKFPSISDMIAKIEYSLPIDRLGEGLLNNPGGLLDKIRAFLELEERYVEVKRKSGAIKVDIRPWVERLELKNDASLEMVVKTQGEKSVRPFEVIKGVLGLEECGQEGISVMKTRIYFRGGDLKGSYSERL